MGGEDDAAKKAEKERRKAEWAAKNAAKIKAQKESKKSLSKAERREKQEAEKAAKAAKNAPKPPAGAAAAAAAAPAMGPTAALVSHLRSPRSQPSSEQLQVASDKIHPAIVALGLKYAEGEITGANARAVAMMTAFKEVIRAYEPPENMSISRDLDRHLKPMIQFLIDCRPHSITMGNAIKHLRHAIMTLPHDISTPAAVDHLAEVIDTYVENNVTQAQNLIVQLAVGRIADGETVLTFGSCHVIERALLEAHRLGRRFKVIVVTARPRHEGKRMVARLAAAGLDCALVLLTSVSYVMGSVSKVFLGANALFSNGAAIGRAGTALVAMTANACSTPVLVCAETHKFTERVQLDSICYNELGHPDKLLAGGADPALSGWESNPCLEVLNLTYDLTPQQYISTVITECGLLPASSVPVIVRERQQNTNLI